MSSSRCSQRRRRFARPRSRLARDPRRRRLLGAQAWRLLRRADALRLLRAVVLRSGSALFWNGGPAVSSLRAEFPTRCRSHSPGTVEGSAQTVSLRFFRLQRPGRIRHAHRRPRGAPRAATDLDLTSLISAVMAGERRVRQKRKTLERLSGKVWRAQVCFDQVQRVHVNLWHTHTHTDQRRGAH